jgi:hypothetical protein
VGEEIEVTEARVTYTTKELLKRIDDRFERMEILVQSAPTRPEFDHLDARVSRLEEDAVKIAAVAAALNESSKKRWTATEKIVGLTFVAANLLLNLAIVHFTVGGI